MIKKAITIVSLSILFSLPTVKAVAQLCPVSGLPVSVATGFNSKVMVMVTARFTYFHPPWTKTSSFGLSANDVETLQNLLPCPSSGVITFVTSDKRKAVFTFVRDPSGNYIIKDTCPPKTVCCSSGDIPGGWQNLFFNFGDIGGSACSGPGKAK